MTNNKQGKRREEMERRVLNSAARLFLQDGYTVTTVKNIAKNANMSVGSMSNLFGLKEDILTALVEYVLEGQFIATEEFIGGATDDKVLFYAAETTLQLYMAESSENNRDLYICAYSMPKSSSVIQRMITKKLEYIFSDYLPDKATADFFKLEIASGGIMRGFMTIPCDMWFTIDHKVDAFLETTLKIFDVPKEKIEEAKAFIRRFDYPAIAEQVVAGMLSKLDNYEA